MDEISPPPQPVRRAAVSHLWRSKAALAGYHIGPKWPRACGIALIFMQDMVGYQPFCVPGAMRRATPLRRTDPFMLEPRWVRFCSASFRSAHAALRPGHEACASAI